MTGDDTTGTGGTGAGTNGEAADGVDDDRSGTLGGFTRREFVRTAGAGAIVATVGAGAAAQADPAAFVRRDGTNLTIDGEEVYFHGANNFWITDSYRGEPSRIDPLFERFEEMGIDFVRTFAACEGGDGDCYVPEPYTHDEGAYETLDYLIEAAERHGIRLNLVLADNWDHNGGIAKYVDWVDSASEHGDFFVDENVRELYRWHVEETLTRTNGHTGREYREEPAIAMWELCNEPRLEGDDTTTIDDRAGALESWFEEMAAFVHDLDDNHLVSSGTEGFYTREDRTEWFYGDWTAQDFVRHHSVDGIDVCSFHMYPHWWNLPLEYCSTWIAEHVRDAHERIGKPAYLGEFNVNREEGLERRNRFLAEWYETADAYNCDAASIWQIVLPATHDHDGFQVYRSESGDVLAEYAEAVRAKSTADLVTDEDDPTLVAPTGVVAVGSGECVEVRWSRVSGAREYALYRDGERSTTTPGTRAVIGDVDPGADYDIGVAAIGPDGSETDPTTRTVAATGPGTVDVPAWERGTVYEGGDRVVHNGIVWEAQWYTDDEEPRFESGYAWSFVRTLGTPVCAASPAPGGPDGTPTPTPTATPGRTPTPLPTVTPTPTATPDDPAGEDGPAPIDGTTPTDPDGDGHYEDLNGSGDVDYDDVVTYFQHMDGDRMRADRRFYDYNDNGRIDYSDLIDLFEDVD